MTQSRSINGVYRIRDWDSLGFEVSQNRRTSGPLSWVAVPTKHDGRGYRRLLRRANGPALYGSWIVIVAVAAKMPTRGVLMDAYGPLTAEDISLKTDFPIDLISEALTVLCNEIGWMEHVAVDNVSTRGPPVVDNMSCYGRNGTDGTERISESVPIPPALAEGPIADAGKAVGPSGGADPIRPPNRNRSVFRNVTRDILADPQRLRNWFDWQLTRPEGMASVFTSGDWEKCRTAAVTALQRAKNPAAYFAQIVGGKRESYGNNNASRTATQRGARRP